jgi:hypothetical protein
VEIKMRIQTAKESAEIHNNGKDSATTLFYYKDDQNYELRVCGIGDDAFFEWINEFGDVVDDIFYTIDLDNLSAGEVEIPE